MRFNSFLSYISIHNTKKGTYLKRNVASILKWKQISLESHVAAKSNKSYNVKLPNFEN